MAVDERDDAEAASRLETFIVSLPCARHPSAASGVPGVAVVL